jgi:hypothetical protein
MSALVHNPRVIALTGNGEKSTFTAWVMRVSVRQRLSIIKRWRMPEKAAMSTAIGPIEEQKLAIHVWLDEWEPDRASATSKFLDDGLLKGF